MKPHAISLFVCLVAMFGAPANAGQPAGSTIQVITPGNQAAQPANFPAGSNANVRQRQAYGKGYRYGNSVNGPNGNIIIWSAAPDNAYGSAPIAGHIEPYPVSPAMPPVHQQPHYGETTNPDYGD